MNVLQNKKSSFQNEWFKQAQSPTPFILRKRFFPDGLLLHRLPNSRHHHCTTIQSARDNAGMTIL
jgi:hypothetical protein